MSSFSALSVLTRMLLPRVPTNPQSERIVSGPLRRFAQHPSVRPSRLDIPHVNVPRPVIQARQLGSFYA